MTDHRVVPAGAQRLWRSGAWAGAFGLALGLIATPVWGANWLLLQGTEPGDKPLRIFGFIQPEYEVTQDSELAAGPWTGQDAAFNQIPPGLDTSSNFSLRRARLGARGAIPQQPQINYFLLVEFGDNGLTNADSGSAKLTDASVTLNYLPGARIRAGQFKMPIGEEGWQAIGVINYVNYTSVTSQLVLERFFDSADGFEGNPANAFNGATSGFRDIGIQVFDAFRVGKWEHSYAAVVANGNGIARSDNDDNKDVYLYGSTERIFAGKGGRRQGAKLFGWWQDGERTLDAGPQQGEFDRTRYGVGATLRLGKWRASSEYIKADGMIFTGADGGAVPGSVSNDGTRVASFNIAPEEEADGYFFDVGYRILPKLELDFRYDRLNRATEDESAERRFDTFTLGFQYFLHKNTRITVNYEFREAEAPNLAGDAPPNQILDEIDDRFGAQVLVFF